MPRPTSLSKTASKLVLSILQKEKEPLSAYQILDKLKVQGIKSPPIIYRALDKLLKNGSVHRIEHLNAYIACNHKHSHGLSIITICGQCKTADELDNLAITQHVEGLRTLGVNLVNDAVLELPVTCAQCASPA